MKAKKLFFALALVCVNLMGFAQTSEPCGTDELILRNPFLESAINGRSANDCDTDYDLPNEEVLTIPIVFHIMHGGTPLGVDENISNAQIYSAVENLTDRFRATPGALGVDENTIDSRFDFCLAGTDPDGNPTNGIVRYDMSGYSDYMEDGVTTNPSFYSDAMPDNTLKDIGCWDPDFYCNVYIVTEINGNNGGNGVQGYAYLGPTGDCRDGIVCLYNVVGTEGTLKPGRDMNTTLPHEMGHYLTLYHTFHNGASSCDYVESNCCTNGDRVCDTPLQTSSANGCQSVCDSDPANYMDYTSQTCKTLFTEGQIERMRDCTTFQRQDLVSGTVDCFQLDDEPTCDVELIGYDPVTHQVSVAILNGENCGCNEWTTIDGNTCGPDNSSTTVMNNSSITSLVFGLHYDSFEYDTPCAETTQFHPNWTFVTSGMGWELFTGDTATFTLDPSFGWECILDNPQEDLCWELVIWQINLSQTVDIIDFPTEYWTDTCGVCADQTQMYPDIDLSNNTLNWCPDELPPPPLYPGCTDELAVNFDPNATTDDGSCEYPAVLGCTDPTACNYDQNADENDGSCITCDTPNGEELCNAYHNDNDYWDFYCNLFGCCVEESIVDIRLDSLWVEYTSCNIFNQPQGACQPGIRYHQVATNIGTDSIYSYIWSWTGPNGYTNESVEFGVNFPNGPFYAVALPPGQQTNVLNTFNQELVWEEGDELCVTVSVIGDQVDSDLTNNTYCITLPAYPVCIWGCMDPCAENYNPDATCDNENCEYPDPIVDTVYVELPQDTVFIETIDTVFVELPQDTLIVELPPDTIVEYIQITDTLEIEVIEYVYLTDTIVEVQFIDCNTGLPCEDEPPGNPTDDDCWPWSVYIPNTFTPNNDGWNDAWKIILDLGCWVDIEFRIYNRWGGLVFEGYGDNYDSYPYWDGSMQGGPSYVADGIYVYTFTARRWNSPQVHQKNGHITIFR